MSRTRDVDPSLRRNAYLSALSLEKVGELKRIKLTQREELVRTGLGDRELKVRQAAAHMIGTWLDAMGDGGLLKVSPEAHASLFASDGRLTKEGGSTSS